MKVGVSLSHAFFALPAGAHAAFASRVEALGYESIWVSDRLVLPAHAPTTYPYTPDGKLPFTPQTPRFDPLITLSHIAAATKRLRLGTSVYILPLRNPHVTARAAATLDVLSNGRVILGVGLGWLKDEFDAVREGFDDRAARSVEIVGIMRRLWTQETTEFNGEYYKVAPVVFHPKPVQDPLPIHFGGQSLASIRRAVQMGDGWLGRAPSIEETRRLHQYLYRTLEEAGREKATFETTIRPTAALTVDNLRRYEDAGAHRVIVAPWTDSGAVASGEHMLAGLEKFSGAVLSKL